MAFFDNWEEVFVNATELFVYTFYFKPTFTGVNPFLIADWFFIDFYKIFFKF